MTKMRLDINVEPDLGPNYFQMLYQETTKVSTNKEIPNVKGEEAVFVYQPPLIA